MCLVPWAPTISKSLSPSLASQYDPKFSFQLSQVRVEKVLPPMSVAVHKPAKSETEYRERHGVPPYFSCKMTYPASLKDNLQFQDITRGQPANGKPKVKRTGLKSSVTDSPGDKSSTGQGEMETDFEEEAEDGDDTEVMDTQQLIAKKVCCMY